MMATIKMPQQGRDCYCFNSQGILIFAIHGLFHFVIFFVSILSGKCLSTQSIACPPSSLYVHQTTFQSQSSTNSILLVSIHALGENKIGSGLGIWRSWPSAVKFQFRENSQSKLQLLGYHQIIASVSAEIIALVKATMFVWCGCSSSWLDIIK